MIVDDEPLSQRVIRKYLNDIPFLELRATCSHALEAMEVLKKENIQLIFLDINMPQQSGIDFYKSLAKPPAVIFTTAYPQYAVDGFEVNATDYLLKPIAYERFLVAINKVLTNTSASSETDFIILKENKALHKARFEDILFVEAYGDYVKVHLNDKTITTHSTFSGLIAQLPKHFIRTHKSFSVNINKLSQLSGNQIMVASHKIPIGQTYKTKVLEALHL